MSSEELAARGQTTAAQVRKDLSHFGSFGKRGLGYQVDELRAQVSKVAVDRFVEKPDAARARREGCYSLDCPPPPPHTLRRIERGPP